VILGEISISEESPGLFQVLTVFYGVLADLPKVFSTIWAGVVMCNMGGSGGRLRPSRGFTANMSLYVVLPNVCETSPKVFKIPAGIVIVYIGHKGVLGFLRLFL
jgi:hypothetical protein